MSTQSSLITRVRRLMRHESARREAHDGPPAAVEALPTEPRARTPRRASMPTTWRCSRREARYHRDRLALYRARVYADKPTSAKRLGELERTSVAADARLTHARGRRTSRPSIEYADASDRRSAIGNER